MKVFLAMAAVLAWLFALVLLLFPSKSYAPTGMMLTASADEACRSRRGDAIRLGVIKVGSGATETLFARKYGQLETA